MPKNTVKSSRKRRTVEEENKEEEYDPKGKFSWQEGDIVFTKKPQEKTKSLTTLLNRLKEKLQKEN